MTTATNPTILVALRQLVKKRLALITVLAVLGGLAGVLFAYLNKVKYVAITTFALEDEGGGSGRGILGLASQFGLDLSAGGAGIFNRDNMTELLLSRRIVEGTLLSTAKINGNEATLADHLLSMEPGITELKNASFYSGIVPEKYTSKHDSMMTDMYKYVTRKMIEVREPDKRRNIFTVVVNSPDDVFSKIFSERLMSETSNFYVESRIKRARQNVDILQKRADSVRAVLNASAYSKAASADANVNPVFQQSQVNLLLKQSDITVAATAYGELIKNLEFAKYALLRQTPLVQIIDSPRLPLEKKGYSRLISGIAGAFLAVFVFILFHVLVTVFRNLNSPLNKNA